MQHSDLHKKKKAKNYAVLAAIVVFMLTIFFVTIIRIKEGFVP